MKPLPKENSKIVLVIDPAVHTPEAEAYNNFATIVDEVNGFDGLPTLSLRFWLPARGNHTSLEHLLKSHPEVSQDLVGCVSLGSAANITDEPIHRWIADYERFVEGQVLGRGLPFLGICFAHQFVAVRDGALVDYASDPRFAGMRFHVEGKRQVRVTSFKMRLLLNQLGAAEWNRCTARSQDFRDVLAGMASGVLSEDKIESPVSRLEHKARQLAEMSPAVFEAWARHWQIVHRIRDGVGAGPLAGRHGFIKAMGSDQYPLDGLVHPSRPWFSVQTHPERPMTETSRRLLLNFFLLCGVSAAR
jgi:GMP synthase-like glutamine amidotransferase